jgi:hypothetical protein
MKNRYSTDAKEVGQGTVLSPYMLSTGIASAARAVLSAHVAWYAHDGIRGGPTAASATLPDPQMQGSTIREPESDDLKACSQRDKHPDITVRAQTLSLST